MQLSAGDSGKLAQNTVVGMLHIVTYTYIGWILGQKLARQLGQGVGPPLRGPGLPTVEPPGPGFGHKRQEKSESKNNIF